MTETTENSTAEVAAPVTPKKKVGGIDKSAKKASHPPTSQMVTSAIKELKERGGSSLQAIKKYMNTTYKVDAEKMSFFIRKYIKSAVENGELVQTKGKGAAGSFRLGGGDSGGKKKSKTALPKAGSSEKKAAAQKPKSAPVKKRVGSASKAKKTKKPPTTPKAPKPKKALAPAKGKKGAASKKTKARKPPAAGAKKASPKKK